MTDKMVLTKLSAPSYFGRSCEIPVFRVQDGFCGPILNCDMILVVAEGRGGWIPLRILLPHQLYEHTAKELSEANNNADLYVFPLSSESKTHVYGNLQ